MTLRSAHIILIAAAMFLVVVLFAYGVHRYATQDDVTGLILAGAGAATGVGLGVYLRYFARKTRT